MKAKKPDTGLPLTLTLEECAELFRSRGIPMDKKRLSDGIKSGHYPGRVINISPTGRAKLEIWTIDVLAFLEARTPSQVVS